MPKPTPAGDADERISRIEQTAADLQQTFDAFRARQIEGDGSVPTEDKQELHTRLKALDDELNGHLAGEYGAEPSKKDAYAKWLKSHQPFHWFVEFYGIVSGGGFDVIIGNPPYLEYSKVTDYRVRNYATERCANLYVFTLERSFALSRSGSRVGMIVPISVACSGAMEPLREHIVQTNRSLWLSHFSNRPGQLFTGAQNRLTILVTSSRHAGRQAFSSRYHRWDAKNGERENLFPALRYQETGKQTPMFHGLSEYPIDLSNFSPDTKVALVDLSTKLAKCFSRNATEWRKSALLIDSIDSKPCKPIIDEIDQALARHYEFTEEELDFIINYDIKYRMGRDAESRDE